jgi:hypothetical protein
MSENAIEDSAQLTAMLRSHVERALQQSWEQLELQVDHDGDYPFRYGTAACWVSVVALPEPFVRVFAHAARDVPRSVKMLAELNELNGRSIRAKVSWGHGLVVADTALHWSEVTQGSLERALLSVANVADDSGAMIAAVYGGSTPFPIELDSIDHDEEAA